MTNTTHLTVVRSDGEPEPEPAGEATALDVRTIDAVTRLLGQVERTARAQRPVIVHSAPAAVAEPARASGPEPIDVRIPPAPATSSPASEPAGSTARLFTRAEVSFYCGMTTLGTGGLGFALAHLGANPAGAIPIAGALVTFVSGVVIVFQDGRYSGAGDHRGRVKVRGQR